MEKKQGTTEAQRHRGQRVKCSCSLCVLCVLCASVPLCLCASVVQSLCVAISLRLTVIDEKGVNLKDTQSHYTLCRGYATATFVFMS